MNFLNGYKRITGLLIALASAIAYVLTEPVCAERASAAMAELGLGSGLTLAILGLVHAREKTKSKLTEHDPGA